MKTKKQGRIRSFYRNLLEEFHKDKSTFIIYITLRTLVILIAVLQFLNGNYENAMLCVFTLLLFLIPVFVQATFRVELPSALEIIVLFFIFAAEILGEINDYYVKYAFWDTMLHTANGFLAAAVGLSLIDILNKSERVQLSLSPLFVALTSFCFSMTIGVLWEFFEFGMDYFFLTDMQKDAVVTHISSVYLNPENVNRAVQIKNITDTAVNGQSLGISGYLDIGLYDTMKDLLVNFVGAVVFSIIGFFYTKYSGRGRGRRVVDGLRITKRQSGAPASPAATPDPEPADGAADPSGDTH